MFLEVTQQNGKKVLIDGKSISVIKEVGDFPQSIEVWLKTEKSYEKLVLDVTYKDFTEKFEKTLPEVK